MRQLRHIVLVAPANHDGDAFKHAMPLVERPTYELARAAALEYVETAPLGTRVAIRCPDGTVDEL